jgi:hypothetical protein
MQSSRSGRASVKVGVIIIASFVWAGLWWLLPARGTDPHAVAPHLRVAIGALAMAAYTGAGLWFISNLRYFTAKLRRVYLLVTIGLITYGFALLQLPVIGLFNLWESFWVTSGAVILFFALTPVIIYLGMRQYARLVHAKSIALSYWPVLAVMLAFGAATYVVSPHLVWYPKVADLTIYLTVVGTALVILTASTIMAWSLARSMGSTYQKSMRWLAITLTAMSIAGLHEYITSYFENDTNVFYVDYGIYLVPWVIAGFIALRAAYAFNNLTHDTTIVVEAAAGTPLKDQDYLDSILALVARSSNPQDLDRILDNMRFITSKLMPGMPLHDSDKQQLLATYRELEIYLTSGKDPARVFTAQELRAHLTPAFKALLAKSSPPAAGPASPAQTPPAGPPQNAAPQPPQSTAPQQ